MSRMVNPGPPAPRALVQARSGDRPWPGDSAWRTQVPRPRTAPPTAPPTAADGADATGSRPAAGAPAQDAAHLLRSPGPPPPPGTTPEDREATLVREVNLTQPLPRIPGGPVTRARLLLRLGDVAVGDLLVPVPAGGLAPADVGAAIAARIGARRPRPARRAPDGQPRSRRRGSTSSL